ncbi:threonine synthase-like 2 isoform X4 [Phodopus roborovskii]|uniref:threonine synthase-like 2 isoform X4 n=1 Tax=Phodopus roborovskii TaxID=109678 RepID=UPI0021E5148B|nr:threonine synthase-like 2 isoform X4 [Phodopus roborovskii]
MESKDQDFKAPRIMWYTSTRGGAPRVNFEGALFSGYAPDGGLYMPEELPQLDRETLCRWSTLSYRSLVKELCALFIGLELIPRHDLNDLIDQAFSRFRHRDVVHLHRLRDGLNILELWHGVTYAFKDLSLSCTAQFMQYFLQKRKKHVTIVVGTSGDTGSAAIESVQGLKNVDIIVLLPKGRCTKIQELQMTTVLKENVRVFGAGCIAQKMGLPIRLVVAVNGNDIIHRTVQKGDFSLCEVVKPTLASAMDIQVPYNMERIFWLLSGSDSQATRALMEQFERSQSLHLPKELHSKLSEAVTSESVSDEAIIQTMGRCWEENQYLLCPHSATAVNYHYQQSDNGQSSSISRCCLAPASAAKFPEAVQAAGLTPQTPAEILALEHKETRCIPMQRGDDWTQMLRCTIEGLSQRWEGCAVNSSE